MIYIYICVYVYDTYIHMYMICTMHIHIHIHIHVYIYIYIYVYTPSKYTESGRSRDSHKSLKSLPSLARRSSTLWRRAYGMRNMISTCLWDMTSDQYLSMGCWTSFGITSRSKYIRMINVYRMLCAWEPCLWDMKQDSYLPMGYDWWFTVAYGMLNVIRSQQ